VAQNILVRLLAELDRGNTYSVPFRVVVHQVIGWTIQDYFAGRPTDLPLPENWEPTVEGESDQVVSRYYLEDLLADLPGKTGEAMTLRYLRGYEPGEIAGELGIEPNAVYQLLRNGGTSSARLGPMAEDVHEPSTTTPPASRRETGPTRGRTWRGRGRGRTSSRR
jgi:DNA-directed RNA polymerase specialized sigma24 family protein